MSEWFANAHQWLFETVMQPAVQALGLASQAGEVFDGTGWLLAGLLQLLFIALVIGALERWRPVEAVADRHAVRIDFAYTLIHRLGFFRLALFFTLDPFIDALAAQGRLWGWRQETRWT